MSFIRARTEKQIEERVNNILKATLKMFKIMPYEKISLGKIANEIGISKPALYKYFPSKEAIFFSIYKTSLIYITDSLIDKLEKEKDNIHNPEDVVNIIIEVSRQDKEQAMLFYKINSLIARTIENNADYETIYNYRKFVVEDIPLQVKKMSDISDYLTLDGWAYTLFYYFVIASGLYPVCIKTGEFAKEIQAMTEFKLIHFDLEERLKGSMIPIVQSLKEKEDINKSFEI